MFLPESKDFSCSKAFSADGDGKAIVDIVNPSEKLYSPFNSESGCWREGRETDDGSPGVVVQDSTVGSSSLVSCLVSSSEISWDGSRINGLGKDRMRRSSLILLSKPLHQINQLGLWTKRCRECKKEIPIARRYQCIYTHAQKREKEVPE